VNRREFFLAVTATVMPESLAARRYRITMQKAREVAKLLGITTFRSNGTVPSLYRRIGLIEPPFYGLKK
jgi:hypothetical protein